MGASLSIGMASFAAPFAGALLFARYVLGWAWPAAAICGIALSTTSVAVVYAVMVESGLNRQDFGELILAHIPVPSPDHTESCSRSGAVTLNIGHNIWDGSPSMEGV